MISTWREDTQAVFEEAIKAGRLSLDRGHERYVGHYMYMGTWGGVDTFKHRMTRQYLKADISV